MKRLLSLCLALLLALTACSASASNPTKAGVTPYALDDEDQHLLTLVGRKDARLISFQTPAEARQLSVHVYELEKGAWTPVSHGTIGADSGESLAGTLVLLPKGDGGLDFSIECMGLSSYSYDPTEPLPQAGGKMTVSLSAAQDIELDKDIPVYLTAWGGNTLPAADLQDFFTPEKFAGLDRVQVVTIAFSAEGL